MTFKKVTRGKAPLGHIVWDNRKYLCVYNQPWVVKREERFKKDCGNAKCGKLLAYLVGRDIDKNTIKFTIVETFWDFAGKQFRVKDGQPCTSMILVDIVQNSLKPLTMLMSKQG